MIGTRTRTTFFDLLFDTKMTARELSKLVEINGVQHLSEWDDWQAALPGNPNGKEVIGAALEEIATFAKAFATNDTEWMSQFYVCEAEGEHHPLHNYGFNLGRNGELLVEKSPLQTQEDQLRQVQSDLANAQQEITDLKNQLKEISTWTGFDDVEEELVPKELDIALMVYRDAIREYDFSTGLMNNGDRPKDWIKDKVENDYLKGKTATADRISMVANWSKGAGRPPKPSKS